MGFVGALGRGSHGIEASGEDDGGADLSGELLSVEAAAVDAVSAAIGEATVLPLLGGDSPRDRPRTAVTRVIFLHLSTDRGGCVRRTSRIGGPAKLVRWFASGVVTSR